MYVASLVHQILILNILLETPPIVLCNETFSVSFGRGRYVQNPYTKDAVTHSSCVVGISSGLLLVPPSTLPTLPAHLQVMLDQYDISLPDFPSIDWSGVSTEWDRFKSNIPEPWKLANDGREFQVGDEMRVRGLEAKFPVILIPGIISTVSSNFPSPVYHLIATSFRDWSLGQRHLNIEVSSDRKSGVAFR